MEVIGHPSKLSQLGRIEFDYLHLWLNHDCALFRHLGVASESGVWGEGKDRVILCTNKNVKIQSYHWQLIGHLSRHPWDVVGERFQGIELVVLAQGHCCQCGHCCKYWSLVKMDSLLVCCLVG